MFREGRQPLRNGDSEKVRWTEERMKLRPGLYGSATFAWRSSATAINAYSF